jgi:enoyl-CoA hydratase/carnithine racemase
MKEHVVSRDAEGPARTPEPERVERAENVGSSPLFAGGDLDGFRARWSGIQTGFVDEPRKAVEQADALVAELMQRLTDGFAVERRRLEEHWERNDKVSTEDLRQAMHRYRSFFERLLSI